MPDTLEKSRTRLRLVCGSSIAQLAAENKGKQSRNSSVSDRIWFLQSSKLFKLLQEYVDDEKPLLNTLHFLDAELVKSSDAESSYIIRDIIPFLKALQSALKSSFQELSTDYLTLDSACRIIFRQMESRMWYAQSNPMGTNISWEEGTNQGKKIVLDVLDELIEAKNYGEETPLADIALDVVDKCWMWEHRADRKEAEGCCIERATASDYIHNQMSKQVTNRVT